MHSSVGFLRRGLHSVPTLHRAYKFSKSMSSVPRSKLLNFSDHKLVWFVITKSMLPVGRMLATIELVDRLNRGGVPGDIVECGVWSGGGLGLMALADIRAGGRRNYVGFDSFEGLPQPVPDDGDVYERFSAVRSAEKIVSNPGKASRTAIGACVGAKEAEVRGFLVGELGLPDDRVELHRGWFEDTVPRWAKDQREIAHLRLDGDLYRSTRVCLDHLFDLVSPGGIVSVDDYGDFPGCKRAVDEFRDERNIRSEIVHVDENCIWFSAER